MKQYNDSIFYNTAEYVNIYVVFFCDKFQQTG